MRTHSSLREEAAALFPPGAIRRVSELRWRLPPTATDNGGAPVEPRARTTPAYLTMLEAPHLRLKIVAHLSPGRPLRDSPLLLHHPEAAHPRFIAQSLAALPGALLLALAPALPTSSWLGPRLATAQALAAELPGAHTPRCPSGDEWPHSPGMWADDPAVAALWAELGVCHPYADVGALGTVQPGDLAGGTAQLRAAGNAAPPELDGVLCAAELILGRTPDPTRAARGLLAECWRGPVTELAGFRRLERRGLWPWQGAAEALARDPHGAMRFAPVTDFPCCLDATDPFGPGLLDELARTLARAGDLRGALHTIRNAGALARERPFTLLTRDALRLHAELATALDPDGAAATLATLAAEA